MIEPDAKRWLMWISELQALSQSGLTFTQCDFDRERYVRLQEIAAEIAAQITEVPLEDIKATFTLKRPTYATPIIDIRSFVLQDDKILMVKEKADGLWTLPGGYADVNESPSEAVARETLEESGYVVKPKALLALWDKLKHGHPLHWPHIYKCVFHCDLISGVGQPNLEISDIDFFSINAMPPLSTPRITLKQLQTLYNLVHDLQPTQFD